VAGQLGPPAAILDAMAKEIRFNLRRMIVATTIVAVAAALAFQVPNGRPGAWRNAADFAQFCLVFTTPLLALAVLFGRPLFWLVVALGMLSLLVMFLMIAHQ
jgi:hypothetical protein